MCLWYKNIIRMDRGEIDLGTDYRCVFSDNPLDEISLYSVADGYEPVNPGQPDGHI